MTKENNFCNFGCVKDPVNGPAEFWGKANIKWKIIPIVVLTLIYTVLSYLKFTFTTKHNLSISGDICILLLFIATPVLYAAFIYLVSYLFKGSKEFLRAIFSAVVALKPMMLAILIFLFAWNFKSFGFANIVMQIGLVLTAVQLAFQLIKTQGVSGLVAFIGTPFVIFLTNYVSNQIGINIMKAFII